MGVTKRIGILTAGGDCPGLNAVIRAVVKTCLRMQPNVDVIGIRDGFSGLVDGRLTALEDRDVSGILVRGGTILGTTNRDNPFRYVASGETKPRDRSRDALDTIQREKLDGLITIGGEGTHKCALEFAKLGVPVIGVPKTIDNDLSGTDITFGFDSALAVATEAVDRLHTTAESHHRVLICEVMGRHAGWIALRAGTAGGGDAILIPEIPYRLDGIYQMIDDREKRGKNFSIMVVAEGAAAEGGEVVTQGRYKGADHRPRLGGVSHAIAEQIEAKTGTEARVVILGHLQRGGTPTPHDRWLATQFGVKAAHLAMEGRWGEMAALHGTEFTSVPIQEAVHELKRVDPRGSEVSAARAVGTVFGD